MDLITTADLAKHFQRTADVIETAAKRVKLESMSLNGANGPVQVFVREKALELLGPILRPAPEASHAPALTPAALTTALVPMFERLASFESKLLRTVEAVGAEAENREDKALEHLTKLIEQNIVINRVVHDLRTDVLARLDAMQAAIDALLPSTPEPAASIPPDVPAHQAKKPRVAIVSLLNSQKALIEREYGEIFDLRIVDSEDQRKGTRLDSFVSNCDYVVGMTNFIGHSTEASVRSAGAKLIRVNGGMSKLREALTDLYVNGHKG